MTQGRKSQRYLSGRSKIIGFSGLSTDRHLYVEPGQLEPNFGFPGEKSLPVSSTYYKLITVDNGSTFDRYWQEDLPATLVNGVSIFDEGTLVGTANTVSKLDFVGSAVSATASGTISTITVTPVSISTEAPSGARHGDLWWDSDEGELNVYYQDLNSAQWVLANSGIGTTTGSGGGGGGGANVTVSSNPPGTASNGDLWWDSDVGELYIYYTDGDSNQWVETSGGSETVTISDNAPSSPNDGDLWWESNTGSLKIYYNDGDSQQWVDSNAGVLSSLASFTAWSTNSTGIHTTSNVGIGTTTADAALTVDGNARITGITTLGNTIVTDSTESNSPTTGSVKLSGGLGVVKNIYTSGGVYVQGTAGLNVTHSADINGDLDVDGHTNLDNVSIAGVSTFTGDLTVDTNTFHVDSSNNRIGVGLITPARKLQIHQSDSTANYLHVTNDTTGSGVSDGALFGINSLEEAIVWNQENDNIIFGTNNTQRLTLNNSGHLVPAADATYNLGTNAIRFANIYGDYLHGELFNTVVATTQAAGNNTTKVATTAFVTTAIENANVGITTNLSGSFTASAGTPATINTLTGYSANDLVVEYTIYIKNGSDFQTQKLLAMRDGTTIHSTQFAVMFSSSLLVQCDATISSGNILLRATPETGVSGSTTYKIKREVM